jgi:hypothetical protein
VRDEWPLRDFVTALLLCELDDNVRREEAERQKTQSPGGMNGMRGWRG